jgi:FkbM family methyltransferase
MLQKIKSSLVQSYYLLRYPEARELKRKGIRFDHYRELNRAWLKQDNIRTIFDVGANEGQFAKLARAVFPSAKIYSFEPLPDCFEKLKTALPGDPGFFPMNIAAGSSESVLEFFRSVHSPSSSFLQMEDAHKEAFPESSEGQVREAIPVKVNTLDNIYGSVKPEKNILLKIDVQGFEKEVLQGAADMMKEVKVVIMEMSFVKLYTGQPLFHDVYMIMYERGFRFHGTLSQMLHPVTNEVVQIDAIFIKE